MARNRIVRKTTETNSTFQVYGYLLTEKMKRDLRRAGLKTDDNTWAQVFPNADVVYRFNPAKNKSDVYVGNIDKVKYPSGKTVMLQFNSDHYADLATIQTIVTRIPQSQLYYTVHANSVSRTELE